jgi:hypothetical protein
MTTIEYNRIDKAKLKNPISFSESKALFTKEFDGMNASIYSDDIIQLRVGDPLVV